MEKISPINNITFYLPYDLFNYILDLCLKPQKSFTKNISHLALDYMFYQRIAHSNKAEWTEGKDLFLKQYLKIGYIKNLYALYWTFRLVSHEMALKINTYFAQRHDLKSNPSCLSVKTNIYLIYLSNVLSSLNYRLYNNIFCKDDRCRILHLISAASRNNNAELSVFVNMDTNKLSICVNIHCYYQWPTSERIRFGFKKIACPNNKVGLVFHKPTEFFDENQNLSRSFYRNFLTSKDAVRLKHYLDYLIVKQTYRYYQNPPCLVFTRYKDIKKLSDIGLKFVMSYNLKKTVFLEHFFLIKGDLPVF